MYITEIEYNIGIDLGGTKTEIIILNKENQIITRKRIPTRKNTYQDILDTILELYKYALHFIDKNKKYTIGIGIPGIIDNNTQTVINANTTVLIGNPLKDDLQNIFNHEIYIENDANCFAYAETISGATRNYNNVFGIILGTGCGGGIILNKKIYKGRHGIAGEWGHFSIDPNGPQCWCGNFGCIETLISGSGIENQYYQKTNQYLKCHEIIQLAKKNIAPAKEIFDRFLENFGRAIGGIISFFDPDAIVIGGGLSNIDELYTVGIEKIKKYAFYHNLNTPILKNQLGDSAGVYGAAWLWKLEI